MVEGLLSLSIAVRKAASIFHTEDRPAELQLSTETAFQSYSIQNIQKQHQLSGAGAPANAGDQPAAEQEDVLRHSSSCAQPVHSAHFDALWS